MKYWKGKGAQINTSNRFSGSYLSDESLDGIDEELISEKPKTQVFLEHPKRIISRNDSPDLPMEASINPYQGCEHGCVYCYARNSHEYWGFSAGLDFESKIIVKPEAPRILEAEFLKKTWIPKPIMLSGNTDCYQPLERKYRLTRAMLKVCNRYKNPVSIITKNALVTRDIDILKSLAQDNLVKVIFSITTTDESLRVKLEPRTASIKRKLNAMELLSKEGIPVGVMAAPIIPGLNHHEIPKVLELSAKSGASFAGYTVVRLNGKVGEIFKDWLMKNFPDRVNKVWNQVEEMHGGGVNDSTFGRRMTGSGEMSKTIKQLFKISKNKYFNGKSVSDLNTSLFRRGGNYQLFD
ncbi:MAG: PA0069 family radical SAM protein [Ekhidna sp.]|nr:PA0069 family radical SAM protein [Ekhidna sp.]